MRLIWTLLFIILDFVVINSILTPFGGAQEGELWRPSELLVEGQNFRYKITNSDVKRGFTDTEVAYRIGAVLEREVEVHGAAPKIEMGTSTEAGVEGFSVEIIRPEAGVVSIGGEEDFGVNKYSLLATGFGGPSSAWNSYVYHPALYSFYENGLAVGNRWPFLSSDGYGYILEVVKKEETGDIYLCEIDYPGRGTDRLWIGSKFPSILKYEKRGDTGELVSSSVLV